VALKIRVLASTRPLDVGRPLATMYRAEAYDDADPYRERVWACEHEHETVEAALECGMEWLARQGEDKGQAEDQGKGEETAAT
jgi:hypothetical protein